MAATETLPDARLAIVDNDSQDGSFEKLRDAVADPSLEVPGPRCCSRGHNGGFGAGNNFGIRHNLASNDPADYFYILNPDAFPSRTRWSSWSTSSTTTLRGHRRQLHRGPDGVPHHTAFRFPSLISELEAGLGFGPASSC